MFIVRVLFHQIYANYYWRQYPRQYFEESRWPGTSMLHQYDINNNSTLPFNYPRAIFDMTSVSKRYSQLHWITSVIERYNKRDILTTSYTDNTYIPDNSGELSKRYYVKHLDTTVELLVVVDYSMYRKYYRDNLFDETKTIEEIHKYIKILISIVNERYQTINDNTFSIHIQICDILIARNAHEPFLFEYLVRRGNNVNASRALNRFHKWLRYNKTKLKYDHAIILTRYILRKETRPLEGLAYVGTMCDTNKGKSASIVQDLGDFQSAGVIAHELGHSLNVSHDGEGSSINCPSSRNNVMAPSNSHDAKVSANVFHFSQCSVHALKTFIKSPEARCLMNAPKEIFPHDIINDPPGRIYNADTQCELVFGTGSKFCAGGQNRSQICSKLWCTVPGEIKTCYTNNRLLALPGTPCGRMKFCNLGKCVSSYRKVLYNKIPLRDQNCPVGDMYAFCRSGSRYLCTVLQSYNILCCKSCQERRT
ncbi:A disintegrin and metalloproteinase with thrombospondin motifs 18 [Mactra antiquata]